MDNLHILAQKRHKQVKRAICKLDKKITDVSVDMTCRTNGVHTSVFVWSGNEIILYVSDHNKLSVKNLIQEIKRKYYELHSI